MNHKQEAPIIISLGGSLIVPEKIDTPFLLAFKQIIEEHIKQGQRFILVTGGGKVCRYYQAAIREFYPESPIDADWIGIHVTVLNANLVKLIFKAHAHNQIIQDPTKRLDWQSPILIGAGYEPGHSTDYDAVSLANLYGVKKIINLSNIDYVYDSDPRTNPHAQKIETMNWDDFLKIIPKEWTPGLNSPFDPTAARLAKDSDIEVAMINGEYLDRLDSYLRNKPFMGTKIHPKNG